MPWHEHEFSYYFRNFSDLNIFYPWIWLLLAAVAIALFGIRDRIFRFHLLGWTILAFGYLTLISIPPVKLEWYDAPVYPLFAMITGCAIGYGLRKFPGYLKLVIIVPILFVMARKINFIRHDIAPRHPFEYEGAMLRKLQPSTSVKVFMRVEVPEHRLQLDFYQRIRLLKMGETIPIVGHASQLTSGDTVLICMENGIQEIQSQFDTDTLKIWPGLGYELLVKEKITQE